MEEKKNDKNEQKCWICRRGFDESLEEFNKIILSNKRIDDNIKTRYEKGKREFFPYASDQFVEFELSDIEENGDYSLPGKVLGETFIWICPVCSGILESLSQNIDIDDLVTKDDLDYVSISIK